MVSSLSGSGVYQPPPPWCSTTKKHLFFVRLPLPMPSKVTAGGVAFQTNWAAILGSIFLRKKELFGQIGQLYL